jgi:hypothetical protein
MQISKINVVTLLALLLTAILSLSEAAADLIGPTRTLDGQSQPTSRLSVFSEPPEIEVLLDGTSVSTTPMINMQVEPGPHQLQVANSKVRFYITPGQSLRISYFKGKFITLPNDSESDEKSAKISNHQRQSTQQPKINRQPSEEFHPNYWPFNPNGQIY